MKEKPIIFSTDLVKAIIAGNKTQTRRVIKPQPVETLIGYLKYKFKHLIWKRDFVNCAPYEKDQILWIRETWQLRNKTYLYKADYNSEKAKELGCWRPSIFMPREAARLFLKVKNIRTERIQDISEEDAIKEGIIKAKGRWGTIHYKIKNNGDYQKHKTYDSAKDAFKDLWDSINKKRGYGWDINPYVWVIEFERIMDYK